MSHRAKHVILGEVDIEFTVASNGKTFYFFVDRKVFFPKFACHNYYKGFKRKASHPVPSPHGGVGCEAFTLVILNHLQYIGNLLDTFLQWFLHHLLDEDV